MQTLSSRRGGGAAGSAVTVSLRFRFYSWTRDDAHLAGALGAAVHRPLVLVLAYDAVVDADSALVVHLTFYQHVILRLWEEGGKKGGGGDQKEGWKTFTLPKFQYK